MMPIIKLTTQWKSKNRKHVYSLEIFFCRSAQIFPNKSLAINYQAEAEQISWPPNERGNHIVKSFTHQFVATFDIDNSRCKLSTNRAGSKSFNIGLNLSISQYYFNWITNFYVETWSFLWMRMLNEHNLLTRGWRLEFMKNKINKYILYRNRYSF